MEPMRVSEDGFAGGGDSRGEADEVEVEGTDEEDSEGGGGRHTGAIDERGSKLVRDSLSRDGISVLLRGL